MRNDDEKSYETTGQIYEQYYGSNPYDSFESYKSMECQGDESTNTKYDIYVDAIYGTGFHGSLRENA